MKRIATLVAAVALVAPGTALANSTCQAYNQQLCSSVSSNTATNGTPSSTSNSGTTSTATTASSSSTLPFTGLDVVLLAAGGGTLVGAGFVVRRLSRRLN